VRRFALASLLFVAAGALVPVQANADFTSATLLSGTQRVQFSEANAPAISDDGLYVAFEGVVGDISGVFERNLQTGEVKPVATSYVGEGTLLGAPSEGLAASDASAPSVSANGEYVAFTTTADLNPTEEPSADASCPEVYVRDMGKEPSESGAYVLASAGIVFEGCPPARRREEEFPLAGAQAAPAVALSANGQHVVFTVLSPSNLDEGSPTPPSQVAVRDLETDTTTLVSVTPDGQATPGGGAYPSASSEAYMHGPVRNRSDISQAGAFADQITASTAAISAEANAVAWLGTNVSEQVPGGNLGGREVEPLWRAVGDGPSATTKRVLGGAGLEFGYFRSEVVPEEPVLEGALVSVGSHMEFAPPVLSADGHTVAVLANAPPPAGVGSAGLSAEPSTPDSNAYVAQIEDSTAEPVVTPITVTPNYDGAPGSVGHVTELAISPDGTRLAFETDRTEIASPSFEFLSPPNAYTETFETYEANLALGTLQRVTYEGTEPGGSNGLLSFSEHGETLAFASQATNLFSGDAIGASEVYAVREVAGKAGIAPSQVTPPPVAVLPDPDWLLSATAESQSNGEVLLDVQIPGAGRLNVGAIAQFPKTATPGVHRSRASTSHAAHRGASTATNRKTKPAKPTGGGSAVAQHTVAQATMLASGPTEVELHLRVQSRFSSLAARKIGLYAIVHMTFTAPGRLTLEQDIPVTFHRVIHASGKASKSASRSR
jgi:hypothetical protein